METKDCQFKRFTEKHPDKYPYCFVTNGQCQFEVSSYALGCPIRENFKYLFDDRDYILETTVEMTEDLYEKADSKYNNIPLPKAGCSAVRINNFHGRNLDYWYNEYPEYVVKTSNTGKYYSTLGIALFQQATLKQVKSNSKEFTDNEWMIPFMMMDGINEHGLVCNMNMLPLGDNPNHPEEFRSKDGLGHWNRTYATTTDTSKKRRSLALFVRTVLDQCDSVDSAIEILYKYNWYSYFGKPDPKTGETSKTDGLELHFMISDQNKTIIVEFVQKDGENVSDINILPYEKSNNFMRQVDENTIKPIMTNFYLTKWDGDITGFESLPNKNTSLTRYSMGLERYHYLDKHYPEDQESFTAEQMMNYMGAVDYSQCYRTDWSKPYSKIWNTEFCDEFLWYDEKYGSTYPNGTHIELTPEQFAFYAQNVCKNYENKHGRKIRDNSTWHTVNRSVYDIENKKLYVVFWQDESLKKEYTLE